MELDNKNLQPELPYSKLQLLGIDRDKADKLPEDVKKALVSGEVTPLLQVSINARNGDVITLPLKLQMTADNQGNPALMAYPVRAELVESRNAFLRLSPQEVDKLNKGDVIQKAIDVNGEKTQQFLQLDPETKSVIHKRITEIKIEEKVREMEKVNDIELGTQQKQAVREGKPMELNVGDQKVTIGIDLKEPQGFKVIQGDMKEWERQQQIKYDILHPEYVGLVMTDRNRWEYQQVVDRDSRDRALRLDPVKDHDEKRSEGLKL